MIQPAVQTQGRDQANATNYADGREIGTIQKENSNNVLGEGSRCIKVISNTKNCRCINYGNKNARTNEMK